MCSGVYYTHEGESHRVYFPDQNAMLPVIKRDGSVTLLPWGRRKGEPGILPLGGWADLSAINAGRWDEWFPKPVKLAVSGFMERNLQGVASWYDITKGKYIQGLVAKEKEEVRVYVVTIVPERLDADFDRWPRIVSD